VTVVIVVIVQREARPSAGTPRSFSNPPASGQRIAESGQP